MTPLMREAAEGKAPALRALLAAGARVDLQNEYKMTAVMWAAAFGHDDCVQVLLEAKADVSLKSVNGDTALDKARSRGHASIVALLEAEAAKQVRRPRPSRPRRRSAPPSLLALGAVRLEPRPPSTPL